MTSRPQLRLVLIATTLVCLFSSNIRPTSNIYSQSQTNSTPETSEGISLYEKGDDVAAIKALQLALKKDKANLRAWHYLGLCFERLGKTKDARKAHESAARLGDDLLESLFFRLGASDQTRSFQEIHEPLSLAAQSAQKYIALSGKLSKSKQDEWNARVESFRDYEEMSDYSSVGDLDDDPLGAAEVGERQALELQAELLHGRARLWARREAWLKLCGTGLRTAPETVEVLQIRGATAYVHPVPQLGP